MTREIKFKAKRVDNGEWVYGYYVKDPKGNHRIYYQPFDDATSNTYHFVDQKTLCQFIGMLDKKGNEIYESDYVNQPLYGKTIVIWNEGVLSFQYAYHAIGEGTAIGGRMSNTFYDFHRERYEVDGNVYDTPTPA
jgi:uncharacterized phage protein (TIGR01671 family)